jgi:hypothetical protein
MKSIKGVPIVTFPCSPIGLVLKGGQVQQSQHRFVDFFFIDFYFHNAPLWLKDESTPASRISMSCRTLIDDQYSARDQLERKLSDVTVRLAAALGMLEHANAMGYAASGIDILRSCGSAVKTIASCPTDAPALLYLVSPA